MKPPSQIRIESLKFSKESETRLQQRFGLSIEKLKKEITNFKIANNQTRHPEIQKKLRNLEKTVKLTPLRRLKVTPTRRCKLTP